MTEVIKSVCHMCGTTFGGCGIDVHVEDNRVVKIEGTKGHPVNDGRLCAKGLAAMQLLNDPNRLLYPMKRVGQRGEGKWQQITWDEALDTIVARLKDIIETDGAQAIAWLKGQGPGWEDNFFYCQRFMNALGSPNLVTHGHLCHVARMLGHFHTYGTSQDPDYENTKCIVLWGINPFETMPCSIGRRVMRARQKGAKIIVVDPRFSKTAAKADIHVQLRPGSDGALALALLNVIIEEKLYDREFVDRWTYGFDKLAELVKMYSPEAVESITWVPADSIRSVARMYANIKPAVIDEGNGVDEQTNVVQTSRAIAILRTVTGNLNVPGGNILSPEAVPLAKKKVDMTLRKMSPQEMEIAYRKSISQHPLYFKIHYCTLPELMDTLLSNKPYPVKAIISQGMNPVVVGSNSIKIREALNNVSFLVVFDQFPTATAKIADMVLPAATFLERTTLTKFPQKANPQINTRYLQLMRQAIRPMGECRSDYDFISDLATMLGYKEAFPWSCVEEAIDYQLGPENTSFKELAEQNGPMLRATYSSEELYGNFKTYFSLPSVHNGKAALYSTALEEAGYDPLPTYREPVESPISRQDLLRAYPFICTTGVKPNLYTHSQFHSLPWLKEIMPEPWIEIHSKKAKELGILDGEQVVVESLRGKIELKCRIIDTLDPRTVAIPFGWGDPYVGIYETPNNLTPDETRCPISDATSNRCFLVKITKSVSKHGL